MKMLNLPNQGYTPANYAALVKLTSLSNVDFCETFDIPKGTFEKHKSGKRTMKWQDWQSLLETVEQHNLTTEQDKMATTKQQKEVMIKELLIEGTKRELQSRFNLDFTTSIDDIKNEIRQIRNVTEFVVQMTGNNYYIYNTYPKMID